MYKKMFLMACLVFTGFLEAADKKVLTLDATIATRDSLNEVIGMVKEGFSAVNLKLDSIDLRVASLAKRVGSLDSKINFYRSLQTASSFEPMGNLRTIKEFQSRCGEETFYSFRVESDGRKLYPFMIHKFDDIQGVLITLKHDNYSCFSPEFLCVSPEVVPFLRFCLGEAKKIIEMRVSLLLPKDFRLGDAELQLAKQECAEFLRDIDDMLARLDESEASSS